MRDKFLNIAEAETDTPRFLKIYNVHVVTYTVYKCTNKMCVLIFQCTNNLAFESLFLEIYSLITAD